MRASGGGVGELQGKVVERFPGSVWTKGDRRWELRGSRATAAIGCRGGSVPVGLGGDGRAEELRNVEKKLDRGLDGGEDERRRGSA